MKLSQPTGPTLGGQKPKEERIQPWTLGKRDLKHNKLKKNSNNEKAEKYYTNKETD